MEHIKDISHTEASVKIYFTKDYGMFKNIQGNRLLSEGKIKRMIADIEGGLNMLRYCPIIVDKDMNVIDGQHRLFVAKKVGSPVFYSVTEKLTLHEIAKINSNQERWKVKDFIHCYISNGIKDYEVLRDFISEYELPFSASVVMLARGKAKDGGNQALKQAFERGEFRVKHLEKAVKIAKAVKCFQEFEQHKSGGFIQAVGTIVDAGICDFDRLVRKFTDDPTQIKPAAKSKQYLAQLEIIYNRNAKSRTTIF